MRTSVRCDRRKGFGLIEILIVLAVVMMVYYVFIKFGVKGPALKPETAKSLSGQGMDTTNYKTILDSSKKILQSAKDKDT